MVENINNDIVFLARIIAYTKFQRDTMNIDISLHREIILKLSHNIRVNLNEIKHCDLIAFQELDDYYQAVMSEYDLFDDYSLFDKIVLSLKRCFS